MLDLSTLLEPNLKMKFKLWDSGDLKGIWEVYIKIDGVRCHKVEGNYVSRKGKPLYNIPELDFEIAEIYCGDFKTTIENTRTFLTSKNISTSEVYELVPNIDPRLKIAVLNDPTKEEIQALFNSQVSQGYEGLVLYNGKTRLKVKSIETFDIPILDIYEGKNKYTGMLGGFVTEKGKVGSGFTDQERRDYFTEKIIGTTIEVKCMELTATGKFRHPIFLRLREDK